MKLLFERWNRFLENQGLEEDLEGYKKKITDPLFASAKLKGKEAKRIWAQEADHAFFKDLVKVHFARDPNDISAFLTANRRDEVSVSAFLPGEELRSSWGFYGAILEGRVTYAHNDMNCVYSGFFFSYRDKQKVQAKTSGISRRPAERRLDDYSCIEDTILDSDTFMPASNRTGTNELFLDNWKPIGLMMDPYQVMVKAKRVGKPQVTSEVFQMKEIANNNGIPVYDNNMNPFDFSPWEPLGAERA